MKKIYVFFSVTKREEEDRDKGKELSRYCLLKQKANQE